MQLNSTTVALTAQSSYRQPSLDQAFDRLLSVCDHPATLRTARVLLKPNLITARNGVLACTEGRFILAAARWFLDRGARVAVGDSPAFGSARSVLAAIGVLPVLHSLGVTVTEFGRQQPTVLASGLTIPLATAALDCDLLVNLPRVKAHSQVRVTLAVKNCFGCVAGFHKPWWHMAHGGVDGRFAALLVELLAVLPPSLSLVDGIVAMHCTGPIHGRPFPLGVMAAGINPVAVDTALLSLLGIDPCQCPLWLAADRAAIRGTGVADLVLPLASPAEMRVSGFVVPDTLGPIRFNPFSFVKSSITRLLVRLRG